MDKINIPNFDDREDLFDFLIENKSALIAEKKFNIKKADAIFYQVTKEANKAENSQRLLDANTIQVKSIINTTNVFDSHSDVHIPKLWNKSVREKKNLMLLEEHKMSFKTIISDQVKASVQKMTFKELGFGRLKGETEALVFDSTINKDRNEYMFNQYAKGFVKNHSVGMQYVKLELAINSDEYVEEFAAYNKYIDQVANRKDAENNGYFWAVTEAKILEGSAVPMGSNHVTPTQSIEAKEVEPSADTHEPEPSPDTRKGLL